MNDMIGTTSEYVVPGIMLRIPELPQRSRIQVERADEGITLWWSKQRRGLARLMKALFIGVPLTFVIFGSVMVSVGFVRSGGPLAPLLLIHAFAIAVLAVPFIGLIRLLRHEEPESVIVMSDRIRHDTGTSVMVFLDRRMWISFHNLSLFSKLFQKRGVTFYFRKDSPQFLIEGTGLRQLFLIRDGSGRDTVVGEALGNADQRWLLKFLDQWKDVSG